METNDGSADTGASAPGDGFDYSTPEAQRALRDSLDLILEIREDRSGPISRKIALYERTLGLAVIPVLVRRGLIMLARRARQRRRSR
jgi:hypothetical protein